MDDLKIYQYLARKPDSRAQDIADVMGVDLAPMSETLRGLVDAGDLVRHSGQARNGLPCQLYNLSEFYKTSKVGVALLASIAPVPAPAAPAEAVPEPTLSRVERAIAYLAKMGSGGDIEMRQVMGMKPEEYPSSVFTQAVKAGKIVRDGLVWRLGDGTPPVPAKPASLNPRKFAPVEKRKRQTHAKFDKHAQPGATDTVVKVGNVIVATKDATPVGQKVIDAIAGVTRDEVKDLPAALVDQLSKQVQALSKEPDPAPVFRCGMWSDGVLELQRNGRSLVELSQLEHEHLGEFMRRFVAKVDEAVA